MARGCQLRRSLLRSSPSAEDPDFFIEPLEGSDRHADGRFCLTIGPNRRWAGVCRLRLPGDAEQIADAVAEIRRLTARIEDVMWNVGSMNALAPSRRRALTEAERAAHREMERLVGYEPGDGVEEEGHRFGRREVRP